MWMMAVYVMRAIRNIQKNDVYSFVQFKNWASQSRSSAQFTIRDFFNVMKKAGNKNV